jgi:hypothetical protein
MKLKYIRDKLVYRQMGKADHSNRRMPTVIAFFINRGVSNIVKNVVRRDVLDKLEQALK